MVLIFANFTVNIFGPESAGPNKCEAMWIRNTEHQTTKTFQKFRRQRVRPRPSLGYPTIFQTPPPPPPPGSQEIGQPGLGTGLIPAPRQTCKGPWLWTERSPVGHCHFPDLPFSALFPSKNLSRKKISWGIGIEIFVLFTNEDSKKNKLNSNVCGATL